MSLIEHHNLRSLIKGRSDTWLVTGAAGFIGSHLCANLIKLGQKVIAIDNLCTGKQDNIDYLYEVIKQNADQSEASFSFFKADICDYKSIADKFVGVQHVLHQAALGSVPRSIDTPLSSHAANVTGFVNVLEAARAQGISRVVYASSSSVYGDSPGLPKFEDKIGEVLSPYAATKRCNEVYSEAFSECYDMTLIGLRYFNVFGARQDPEGPYAAVIPRWIDALLEGVECTIYGDGTTSRDFCYIDNVVMANLLAALQPDIEAENYEFNVACGEKTSLTELFNMLAEAVQKHQGSEEKGVVSYEEFRKGDIKHSLADISLITNTLGYAPLVKVSEGIEMTVAAYIDARS